MAQQRHDQHAHDLGFIGMIKAASGKGKLLRLPSAWPSQVNAEFLVPSANRIDITNAYLASTGHTPYRLTLESLEFIRVAASNGTKRSMPFPAELATGGGAGAVWWWVGMGNHFELWSTEKWMLLHADLSSAECPTL